MSVTLVVRDLSFLLVDDKNERVVLVDRLKPGSISELKPGLSWQQKHDEFVLDRVETKAVFGSLVDSEGEYYLVVCREAELVASIPEEGRIFRVTNVDLLAYSVNSEGRR